MSATLDQLAQSVTDETALQTAVLTELIAIKGKLDAALAAELTPAAQAKVDAIFAAVEANKTALNAVIPAVSEGTAPAA